MPSVVAVATSAPVPALSSLTVAPATRVSLAASKVLLTFRSR